MIRLFSLTTASRTGSARNQTDGACLAAIYRWHMISSTWLSSYRGPICGQPGIVTPIPSALGQPFSRRGVGSPHLCDSTSFKKCSAFKTDWSRPRS